MTFKLTDEQAAFLVKVAHGLADGSLRCGYSRLYSAGLYKIDYLWGEARRSLTPAGIEALREYQEAQQSNPRP